GQFREFRDEFTRKYRQEPETVEGDVTE
ncbi:MAG: hypothetical protein JWL77_5396, partial [Chthonomonadaceae bacterium]|nr:hypothetical protein [Chthonomonadaceae bacterium]